MWFVHSFYFFLTSSNEFQTIVGAKFLSLGEYEVLSHKKTSLKCRWKLSGVVWSETFDYFVHKENGKIEYSAT